jgi:hypothetical protein
MRKSSDPTHPHAASDHHRSAKRYDIGLSLRYTVRRRGRPPIPGVGRSINLSSSGLLFHTEAKLVPGDSIIAGVDWPIAASNGAAMCLLLGGYVVRIEGKSVAISISRNELLPAQQLKKCFDTFTRPVGPPARRRPILAPTVLFDEDDAACPVIAAIVSPQGWRIERASPAAARKILDVGFPPISLLVTRTLDLLERLDPEIPVILTVEEGAPLPPQLLRLPLLAIMRKPLIYGVLRAAVMRLCEGRPPLQIKETSAGDVPRWESIVPGRQ